MFKILLIAALFVYQTHGSVKSVNNYLTDADNARLEKVFAEGIKSGDLQSVYYSALNYNKISNDEKQTLCKHLLELYTASKLNEFEKNFYLIGTYKHFGCNTQIPQNILDSIATSLSRDSVTAQEIFFNLFSSKALGVNVDQNIAGKLAKNLQNILKKDDSLSSLGYAFYISAELGTPAVFAVDRVEDAIVQADEVDGKMLQFEGGLSITGLVFSGAFKATKAFNKPPPIVDEQSVKFATYFLSRRSVQTAKGAHVLLEALKTLVENKKIAPVCIRVIGNGQLQSESPVLSVTVVDLLGSAVVPPVSSITGKIVNKKGNIVVTEKVQFISRSSDKTVFGADLSNYKLERGIYTADITADGFQQTLNFKVLGKVKVQLLEIGVGDADATSAVRKQTVLYPSTLKEVLNADHTQKVVLKVALVDEATSKVMSVHQTFVRLANKETDEEIIFVAEQDTSKAYKFDMDVGARSADFGHKSGSYKVELIVGDASLSNSFQWHVADIQLKFLQEPQKESTLKSRSPLPEIVHMFRQPEKRPARFVSDLFTGLCLTPLVLLFIFWAKLKINISNIPFSLSTIGFHLGLGAILGLFGVFWLQLNMFETIRYLIPIAIFTFLCGNRMLRSIAAQKATS